jgi:hypothetical protein
MGKILIAMVLAMFVFVGAIGMYSLSVYNRHVDIDLSYEKQLAKLETFHDKMWKTIKSQAKIADKYKDGFNEVYKNIMEGRYSGGSKDGSLMKWIQESNPQFNSSMYEKMMTTVEAQRNGFFAEQDIMQGIVKEGNAIVRKPPSSIVCALFGLEKFEFEPISSSVSKQVMETREDNDLYLGD